MSIRTRLTLWYGAIMALLLLLFGGAVYGILRSSLLGGVNRTLIDTAARIQANTSQRITITPFNLERVVALPPLDVFANPGLFVQARQVNGTVAVSSANLRGQALPMLPQESWEQVLAGRVDLRTVDVGAVRLRLRSEAIVADNQPVGVLQVAISLQPTDATLGQLLQLLLISGGIGLLLAMLVGGLLARQSLAPIAQVTEAARRIAATENLSERIPGTLVEDELGRLVTTYNEMLDRLQRLFQGQQRFLTDVSHELRTPLAAMRGNLEVLQRGSQANPELLQESLRDIEREVVRMSRMVADLLTLARADAGMRLERRPVELDHLLLEVYREAGHLARGVEVRLGREDQIQVLGDGDRLKQLLLNLVDNALKHTPPGGTVTLSLYPESTWACLAVTDTGSGIPKEELPRVFERYYRGKGSGPRKGMGLGLSIARWIAEEHGGQITVKSEEGEGSTFILWLPRQVQET